MRLLKLLIVALFLATPLALLTYQSESERAAEAHREQTIRDAREMGRMLAQRRAQIERAR
jgi:hypothetical protein